jgi:hypothetical protein
MRLGLGVYEFIGEHRASSAKLVDAKAKPWHD